MGVFGLSQVCALLLAGMIGVEGATFPQNGPQDRVLRAATRRSDLSRRSLRIGKKFESEIIYIEEENIWSPKPVFASKVKVDSKKPILNLEHIEHHLEDVHCGDGSMRLHFRDHMAARDAKAACHGEDGGLIITSHSGCNKDGERAVYKVHKSSFSEDGQALELTVVESLWKESFDTFDISFGHTEDDLFYRRHPDFQKLRRRQNEEPKKEKEEEEKKEGETKEGENKEGKGKGVEIPTDTPDDVNTATFDLKYEVVDKTFSVDDFLSSTYLDQVVNTPNLPNIPIEVGCKKCTTTGKLVLTQGNIKINVDEIDLVPDVFSVEASDNKNETIQAAKKDTGSIISGGFIELASKNMGGRFELFARPQQTGSLSIGLPPLPAIGFVIPGVGKAGVSFESSLNLDFEIVKGLDISYGAEMSIPDGTIRLELADVTKSGVNGFKKATIKALPFKSNLTDIDLLVGVAFNPSIPIGFEFADKLEATVTVDMELPRLDARIRTKKNVDANCDPLQKKTKEADTKEVEVESVEALAKKIGPLVLIESNVSVSVDVNLELALPLLPAPFDGIGTAANIFTTQFALPTTCLAPGNGYAIASKVFSAPVKPKVTGGPEAQAEMTPPPAGQSPGAEQTPAPCSTGVPPPPPPDAPAPPCDCGTVTVYVPPTNAPMPPPPPGAPAPPPENPEVPPEGPNTPPPENPQAPPPENPQAPPPENPQAPPPENPQAPPPENPQAPPPENPQAPPPENPQAPPPENPQAPPPENPQAPPPENPAKPPCTTTGVPPPPPPPVLNTTCTGNVTTAPPPPPETPTPPPAETPSAPPPAETPSAPPPADTPIVTDPAPTPTAPTGGVTAPTGFMDPGTPSGPPTTSSTEPLEFDNAAVPRAVSAMDMGTIGWQAGLLITSFGIGAMML